MSSRGRRIGIAEEYRDQMIAAWLSEPRLIARTFGTGWRMVADGYRLSIVNDAGDRATSADLDEIAQSLASGERELAFLHSVRWLAGQ